MITFVKKSHLFTFSDKKINIDLNCKSSNTDKGNNYDVTLNIFKCQ